MHFKRDSLFSERGFDQFMTIMPKHYDAQQTSILYSLSFLSFLLTETEIPRLRGREDA